MSWEAVEIWLAGGGLAVGAAFGVLAQRSRFCVVSALSNLRLMGDHRQFHAYLAALGMAVAGGFLLEAAQWVAIADSGYRRLPVNWIGALGGGLLFGMGAMLAGGCASRTLVRSAEGNLGALLTLLMFALVGMAAQFGALNPLVAWSFSHARHLATGDAALGVLLGWPNWLLPAAVCLACVFLIATSGRWREHRGVIVAGAAIGLLVPLAWWITGVKGADPFDPLPPSSLAVAGPLARGGLWLSTGQTSGSLFAMLIVPGVLVGALGSALAGGEFRWVAPAGERVGAYLAGGALMGLGAVLAGGCNIGQGLTGLSTLSLTSILAVGGILAGMLLVLHRME